MRDQQQAHSESGTSPPTSEVQPQAVTPDSTSPGLDYQRHMVDNQAKFVREAEQALLAVWSSVSMTHGRVVVDDFRSLWEEFRSRAEEHFGIDSIFGEDESEVRS